MANLKLNQSAGSGTITLKGAGSGSNEVELTLPNAIGTNDQVLKLGRVSGQTGTLSFGDAGGGVDVADAGNANSDYFVSMSTAASQTAGSLKSDSVLLYNPANDELKVNGNSITSTIFRGSGGTGTLTNTNNSSTCAVITTDKIELKGNIKENIVMDSGKGIDFSATANTSATGASMSSELFADYEEGSWTPTLAEGSATMNNCAYVRIGNMVYLTFECTSVSDTTSDTNWVIAAASLPFGPDTSFADNYTLGPVRSRYHSHGDNATLHANMNGSGIHWNSDNDDEGDGAFSSFKHSEITASYSAFGFSGWYYT